MGEPTPITGNVCPPPAVVIASGGGQGGPPKKKHHGPKINRQEIGRRFEGARLISHETLIRMFAGILNEKQIWRLEKYRRFPRRIYLSPKHPAWFKDEIDVWIEKRKAERENRAFGCD